VQTFIDLVQRHDQSFYTFVHNVHSKGQGLFDSLMGWIELFLSYARSGLPQPIDLEFILPAGGEARGAIMKEVDAVAQYHYRLKVAHEEKIRRRFRREAAGEEEAALLDSVMASLSLGAEAVAEGGEVESEEDSQDGEEDDEEDDEEGGGMEGGEAGAIRVRGNILAEPEEGEEGQPGGPTVPMFGLSDQLKEKERRGSEASSMSSLDKIRNTLRRSPDHEKEKEGDTVVAGEEQGKGKPWKKRKHPPPPIHVQPAGVGGPPPLHSASHRTTPRPRKGNQRERKVQELMEHPETKAIAELRPLFVEMVCSFWEGVAGFELTRIRYAHF
jgi:hypothetical protein